MQPQIAANKADDIISLLLTHQEDVLGKYCLQNKEDAIAAAQVLAEFRQNLIALLVQQQ